MRKSENNRCAVFKNKPTDSWLMDSQVQGTCGHWENGVRCGKPFTGPRTRKFCDDHSRNVRRSGKN